VILSANLRLVLRAGTGEHLRIISQAGEPLDIGASVAVRSRVRRAPAFDPVKR
jgi:hypothetical protein